MADITLADSTEDIFLPEETAKCIRAQLEADDWVLHAGFGDPSFDPTLHHHPIIETPECWEVIDKEVIHFSTLQPLTLTVMYQRSPSASSLQFANFMPTYPSLNGFIFIKEDNKWHPQYFVDAETMVKKMPNLSQLYLSFSNNPVRDYLPSSIIEEATQLKVLVVNRQYHYYPEQDAVAEEATLAFSETLQQLTQLRLLFLGTQSISANFLDLSSLTNLEGIYLGCSTTLPGPQLTSIAHLPHLHHIHLEYLTSSLLETLLGHFPPHLSYLHLGMVDGEKIPSDLQCALVQSLVGLPLHHFRIQSEFMIDHLIAEFIPLLPQFALPSWPFENAYLVFHLPKLVDVFPLTPSLTSLNVDAHYSLFPFEALLSLAQKMTQLTSLELEITHHELAPLIISAFQRCDLLHLTLKSRSETELELPEMCFTRLQTLTLRGFSLLSVSAFLKQHPHLESVDLYLSLSPYLHPSSLLALFEHALHADTLRVLLFDGLEDWSSFVDGFPALLAKSGWRHFDLCIPSDARHPFPGFEKEMEVGPLMLSFSVSTLESQPIPCKRNRVRATSLLEWATPLPLFSKIALELAGQFPPISDYVYRWK